MAAVLLVAFVLIEQRVAHPLLPLRVVLERNRGGSFLASLLVGVAMLGTFLSLTYYFQGTLHYSALKSGFAFVPFSLGIITRRHAGQPAPAPLRAPGGHDRRPAPGHGRAGPLQHARRALGLRQHRARRPR